MLLPPPLVILPFALNVPSPKLSVQPPSTLMALPDPLLPIATFPDATDMLIPPVTLSWPPISSVTAPIVVVLEIATFPATLMTAPL